VHEAFPRRPLAAVRPATSRPAGSGVPVSLNRIKVAAAARGTSRSGVEVKSAPEDICFRASKAMVARRNALSAKIIKKLARRPTKASFS
jgi:hypothetical protein